jgi:hypothetical protein
MMRRFLYAPLLLLAAIPHANAAVRAWVDNPQIIPGDTVELTLAHDGQTSSQPDLTPLRQDFDIVGRSTSTSLQIVNGRASATTQLTLSLAPKHSGQLTVPSISWDSDRSPPLTLVVAASGGGAGAARGTSDSRIFLETDADPKTPYVQGAVHVTVRVFAALPLAHADLEFPATDAAIVRQVGSDEVNTIERNGQSYQVVTRHYLLFPQHSGHLSVPGAILSGQVPDRSRHLNANDPFSGFFANSPFSGMFSMRKPIRLNSDPITLDVLPRPAGAGMSYWLPAQNVNVTAQLRPTDTQAHVGDPVTLDLKLQAEDLTAAQLPDLSTLLALPPGIKAYPDEPKLKDTVQGNNIVGDREQSVALIAEQPGNYTIPELHLNWWDTRTNQTRQTVIPARTLVVLPMDGSKTPAAEPTPQSTAGASTSAQTTPPVPSASRTPATGPQRQWPATGYGPWPWVSLGLGLLWVATLIGWIRSRRRAPSSVPTSAAAASSPDKSKARTAFHAACRANDANGARRNLLIWANAVLPGPQIPGLSALGKRLEDTKLAELLRDLDRGCYAGDSWDGTALANALPDLPRNKKSSQDKTPRLAPLYR